jgi:hypothetical protein
MDKVKVKAAVLDADVGVGVALDAAAGVAEVAAILQGAVMPAEEMQQLPLHVVK